MAPSRGSAKARTLYINANRLVSRNGLPFPAETLIATFSTRAGVRLAFGWRSVGVRLWPARIVESAIGMREVE